MRSSDCVAIIEQFSQRVVEIPCNYLILGIKILLAAARESRRRVILDSLRPD